MSEKFHVQEDGKEGSYKSEIPGPEFVSCDPKVTSWEGLDKAVQANYYAERTYWNDLLKE